MMENEVKLTKKDKIVSSQNSGLKIHEILRPAIAVWQDPFVYRDIRINK